MNEFYKALKSEDLKLISRCNKADLHNHIALGGKRETIFNMIAIEIPKLEMRLDGVNGLNKWINLKISPVFTETGSYEHYEIFKAGFIQAKNDGIIVLAPNFGPALKKYFGSWKNGVSVVEKILEEVFNEEIILLPELSFKREKNTYQMEKELEEALDTGFFKSVDLIGLEDISANIFKNLYSKAKKAGLVLKAHVGETTGAENMINTIKTLNLDEVHHGLAATQSKYLLDMLKERKIQLNMCPTSNVSLGYCEGFKSHPIKKCFEYGIPVTINSDDILIFNSSVSEEYLKLYQARLFDEYELEQIRLQGLKSFENYKNLI